MNERAIAELERLCEGYVVCDEENYGSVGEIYREEAVPTEREFWAKCGVNAEEGFKDCCDQYMPLYMDERCRKLVRSWDGTDEHLYELAKEWADGEIPTMPLFDYALDNLELPNIVNRGDFDGLGYKIAALAEIDD